VRIVGKVRIYGIGGGGGVSKYKLTNGGGTLDGAEQDVKKKREVLSYLIYLS